MNSLIIYQQMQTPVRDIESLVESLYIPGMRPLDWAWGTTVDGNAEAFLYSTELLTVIEELWYRKLLQNASDAIINSVRCGAMKFIGDALLEYFGRNPVADAPQAVIDLYEQLQTVHGNACALSWQGHFMPAMPDIITNMSTAFYNICWEIESDPDGYYAIECRHELAEDATSWQIKCQFGFGWADMYVGFDLNLPKSWLPCQALSA